MTGSDVLTVVSTPGGPLVAAVSAGAAAGVIASSVRSRPTRLRRGPLRESRGSDRTLIESSAALTSTRAAPAVVTRALHNAALDVDPGRAVRTWLVALAVSVAAGVVASIGPIVIFVVAAGPPAALTALRGRRAALRRRHLPVALDTVASSLRSGRSVAGSLEALSRNDDPLSDELATVAARAGAGRPLSEVVAEWSGTDDADTRLAGAALATAAELGGPAASALETTAQSLRERAASDGVVDALSVQARMSAWLLTVAPLGFAAMMTGIDPAAGHFLFGTPVGWACLALGLGLDLAGGLWMHRMVRKAR